MQPNNKKIHLYHHGPLNVFAAGTGTLAEKMVRKVETFSLLDDLRLSALWREKGWNNQHLKKLWNCLIKRGATSAADVDLMPKAVVSGLADSKFTLLTTTVVSETTSHNASTTKLLIRLQDGHLVEVRARVSSSQLCSVVETCFPLRLLPFPPSSLLYIAHRRINMSCNLLTRSAPSSPHCSR